MIITALVAATLLITVLTSHNRQLEDNFFLFINPKARTIHAHRAVGSIGNI
jgi:hypothetical protein